MRFWRQARKRGQMPPVEELQAAQKRVGYQQLSINTVNRTVSLRAANLQLDLGGIAKGYAVDEAMAVLKANGIARAYVAADSDLLTSGPPPDKAGWKIELRNVDEFGNLYPRTVFLKHVALPPRAILSSLLKSMAAGTRILSIPERALVSPAEFRPQ